MNPTFQASFSAGHQSVPQGTSTLPDGSKREYYEYIFNTLDLNLDYDFVWKWLRARPDVSFRRAWYAGPLFSTWDASGQKTSGSKAIQSASVSVGLEQAPFEKLRFIEAVRMDVYFDRTEHNYFPMLDTGITGPITKRGQTLYPSFQFAVTYTPTEDHILRASYSRASSGPCLLDSYYYDATLEPIIRLGNNALNLLTLDTVELGYRTRFSQQIDMSIEVFGTRARNFRDIFFHSYTSSGSAILQFDNLDTKAYQLGSTVSFGFTAHRFNGRVFATVQQTWLKDTPTNMWRLWELNNPLDPHNQTDTNHVGTPDVYGGFYLNYQPLDKLNINVNAYYFSRNTQIRGDITIGGLNSPAVYTSGRFDIQQSFLLNAKVSYNLWNGLAAFVNLRNLFNINQPQFAWGDANHILCFIGLQFEI